ncbi:MAG: universal stress protein [Acidimicrobiales bacterium]
MSDAPADRDRNGPDDHTTPESENSAQPPAGDLTVASWGNASLTRWQPAIDAVAQMLGLNPVTGPCFDAPTGSRNGEGDTMLGLAASLPGPVLVLPPRGAGNASAIQGSTQATPGSTLSRVLVPVDGTEPVIERVRHFLGHLGKSLEGVVLLHVLSESTRPRLWEGAGYNAEAWLEELSRRHGVGVGSIEVRTGEPADVIEERSHDADLIALAWQGDITSGKAALARALIERVDVPVLLLPFAPVGESGTLPGS